MRKRYLVEFGMGADLHGGDVTKAAGRAIKDAVSHCCMCGIAEIFENDNKSTGVTLDVKIAAPTPEKLDAKAIAQALPGGVANAKVDITRGGMSVTGLHVNELGAGNQILIVNAAITVYIEV